MWEQRRIVSSEEWELHNGETKNWGKARIVYDETMETIYKINDNKLSPWEVPQGDLLAEDWVVIKSV